jgi:murein DD-endopeptidase MepM/ murein hydrolase activator NlpD
MRNLLLSAALLAACNADTTDAFVGGTDVSLLPAAAGPLAPPNGGELVISAFVKGDDLTLTARGFPAGWPVNFVYSTNGTGRTCPAFLGGNCFDLAGPVRLLGTVDADIAGEARLPLTLPRAVALSSVSLQAVAIAPGGTTLSNPTTDTIWDAGTFSGPSCNIDDMTLSWPMLGADASDWVINNYVDLDDSPDLLDYRGGTKTYDGHNGVDIDVSTFREMDADTPIVAAFPGEVVDVVEDNSDRNTSCAGDWNVVKVRHANGFEAFYGHLKRDSTTVSVGDTVQPGDMLGVVGSSGCSSHPHLHFEIRDCGNAVVDPFLTDLWSAPPVYDTPLSTMDTVLRVGGIGDIDQIKDPDPNPSTVQPGATLGIAVSMAGGNAGDSFSVVLRRPDGSTFDTIPVNLTGPLRHHFWWWNRELGTDAGTWRIDTVVDGATQQSTPVVVRSSGSERHQRCYDSRQQAVCWNIDAVDYQDTFDRQTTLGKRPIWVDVSSRSDGLVYDAIFRPDDGTPWVAWHGVDGAGHQDLFDQWAAQGYRLVHVDGAMSASGMRYTAILEYHRVQPGWAAHHGLDAATHQQTFDTHAANGLRAVNVAVADDGGDVVVTSLYDTDNVGGWVQLYGVPAGDYQSEFDTWTSQGMWLSYLDAYDDGGTRFSFVFDQAPVGAASARHGVRSGPMFADIAFWESRGMLVETLTTYGAEPDPRYAVSAADRP